MAQSGGPTAAINSTLAGALVAAITTDEIDHIYGARHGIEGVLEDEIISLDELANNQDQLNLLLQTPSSVLGSCRYRLVDHIQNEKEHQQILDVLKKYSIKIFVYIGGNDSMDTVDKLARFMKERGEDIVVLGAPKTIDNDLVGIDHTPGYGSAAKYIATTMSELERDTKIYNLRNVLIVEIMGRNTGWLTAASALAKLSGAEGPDLIYLSEQPFTFEEFSRQIEDLFKVKDTIIIAVSEGLKNPYGDYVSEIVTDYQYDDFGHKDTSGVAQTLAGFVKREFNCKVRGIELSTLQRCGSHLASLTDIEEARKLGYYAVQYGLEGRSGVMSSLCRKDTEGYEVEYFPTDVKEVANKEKKVPQEWLDLEKHQIKKEFWDYLVPLIQGNFYPIDNQGIPEHLILF